MTAKTKTEASKQEIKLPNPIKINLSKATNRDVRRAFYCSGWAARYQGITGKMVRYTSKSELINFWQAISN